MSGCGLCKLSSVFEESGCDQGVNKYDITRTSTYFPHWKGLTSSYRNKSCLSAESCDIQHYKRLLSLTVWRKDGSEPSNVFGDPIQPITKSGFSFLDGDFVSSYWTYCSISPRIDSNIPETHLSPFPVVRGQCQPFQRRGFLSPVCMAQSGDGLELK